jgi:hypothetical protein
MRSIESAGAGAGASQREGAMTNAGVEKALWWLGLVVAPVVLISIELFHPSHFTGISEGVYQYLSEPEPYDPQYYALGYPGPDWWFVMHMIQTPLVGLVAVGLWLLVGRIDDSDGAIAMALAWLSRAATLVFLIYYTALDTIGGTGLGRLMINTKSLAASGDLSQLQVDGVAKVLNATWVDPWVGGVGSFFSLTGSWAVFIACVFAAAALLVSKKMWWPPLIVLLAFGWELQTSHASPNGPIAFGLLIVAAVWMWWSERRAVQLTPT